MNKIIINKMIIMIMIIMIVNNKVYILDIMIY